jgi:hypothetical protein
VYKPAGADAFFEEMRRHNLDPAGRRTYLAARRLDPVLWPLLHDPSTHWSTYGTDPARYLAYIWEDQQPQKRRRPPAGRPGGGGGVRMGGGQSRHHQGVLVDRRDPQLVDLDREADLGVGPVGTTTDYDVS